MLSDRGHRQTGRKQVQPTDTLLEGGMHGRGPSIAPTRHTGDLTKLPGSSYQPPQSRAWDALLFGDAGLGGPGQHLRHGSQIAVKLLSLWLWKARGIKRRTRQ